MLDERQRFTGRELFNVPRLGGLLQGRGQIGLIPAQTMRGSLGQTVDSVRESKPQPTGKRKGKKGGGARIPRPKRG